ncbi:MAG: serine hydrolase domain-containing protein [Candidatus Bipolaricaulota bacterium]
MSHRTETLNARFRKQIESEVKDKGIPSISYALVDRDGILASGHCVRSDETHRVIDETIFRVGSCSKMFAGIALMQLVGEGKVDLDVDVSAYIPGFEPRNPFPEIGAKESDRYAVTLRKLMSHTAGMVRESSIGHYLDDSEVLLGDLIDGLKTSTLKEDPSAGVFQYSNAGIAVVGRVIERVTGIEFATYVREKVLHPLGMKRSDFCQTPFIREQLAPACMWTLDGQFPAPVFDMGGGGVAGNLFSSISEMSLFVQAMLRGGYTEDGRSIISPALLHSMWEPHGAKRPSTYGLTFGLGTIDGWKSVGHNGAVYGYATQLSFLPEAGIGVVLCATLDVVNAVLSRLGVFGLRLGLEALGMGREPDPSASYRPVSSDELERLSGFYRQKDGGEIVEVVSSNERLYLIGDGVPLRIQPVSEGEFVVDGRLFVPGSPYPHLDVSFEDRPSSGTTLQWRGESWSPIAELGPEPVPDEVASYIGEYGPDFSVTRIFHQGGALKCTIEYFYTHSLHKVSPGVYKMHGLLYDDEILEFDVHDESGASGLRVGAMFLARRNET